jgi:hypothetical protein
MHSWLKTRVPHRHPLRSHPRSGRLMFLTLVTRLKRWQKSLADRDQQVQGLRSDATLAPSDRKAKMHGIRQESDSRIEAILNDTQKQQYEQIKQTRKANRHQQPAAPATT